MTKKKIKLYFQPDKVNEPITYHLVKEYDIKFNILRAVVEEKGAGSSSRSRGSQRRSARASHTCSPSAWTSRR